MTSQTKKPLLEMGLLLVVLLGPLFFGAADTWAAMGLCAFIFLLTFFHPEVFSQISQFPKSLALALGFVLIFVLGQILFFSLNAYETSHQLFRWLAYLSFFFLVLSLRPEAIKHLVLFLIAFVCFEVAYSAIQSIMGKEMVLWRAKEDHLGYFTGTYFNRNHLAGMLNLGLGFLVGLWLKGLEERDKKAILIWGVLLLWGWIGLLKTGSRMGVCSFGLSVLVFLFYWQWVSRKKLKLLLLVLVGLLGVLFLMQWPLLVGRFETADQSIRTWDGGRWLAWQGAWQLFKDYPLFGIGLGNFEWAFAAYQPESLWANWNYLHNDYFELLLNLGLVGFLPLLFVIGGIWILCMRKLAHRSLVTSPLAWGGMIGLTAIGIHGLTDFNWARSANAILTIMTLAIIWYDLRGQSGKN